MIKIIVVFIIFAFTMTGLFAVDVSFDTDSNGKEDHWLTLSIYKKWQTVDVNENDKPDEACLYVSPKKIVYLIKEERYDYTGNGKPDIWITYKVNGKNFTAVTKADSNGDSKVDLITEAQNGILLIQRTDSDGDGVFEVQEEFNEDGEKIKELVDSNNDGKYDDYYYYRAGLNYKEELDSNFDGKADMWVTFEYKPDMSLKECKIEKDNNYDGKVDEWHYSDDKRRIVKIEKDKNFDGKVDETKNFKVNNG